MTNQEIIIAEQVLPSIDGQGSARLRIRVATSLEIVENARKSQIRRLKSIKSEKLKKYEIEVESLRQRSKSKEDFAQKMEEWESLDDYLFEKDRFENGIDMENWLDADFESGTDGKKIELSRLEKATVQDVKGIKLNNVTIRALKLIVVNFDDLMLKLEKEPDETPLKKK